jgi:hypothetical protein
LTFGLGIIILQGVSRRKSLAGVNIMLASEQNNWPRGFTLIIHNIIQTRHAVNAVVLFD